MKLALCTALFVLLAGCVTSKVDGNRVNYANGMSFIISEAYTPVGKVPFNHRSGAGTSVINVFAKKDAPHKEVDEFVGVYSLMLSDWWYMSHQGVVSGNTFWLDHNAHPAMADILKNDEKPSKSKFFCGEFYVYSYRSGQQSIVYCAAESIVPSGENKQAFVNAKFAESVQLVSGSEVQVIQQSSPPVQNQESVVVSETATRGNGKYVVIAYSKNGNTAYAGRSHKSANDALNTAVTDCQYSDCRKAWVSNVDGCVAFAKHGLGAWGIARGADVKEASDRALKLCNAPTQDDNCAVVTTLCPEL